MINGFHCRFLHSNVMPVLIHIFKTTRSIHQDARYIGKRVLSKGILSIPYRLWSPVLIQRIEKYFAELTLPRQDSPLCFGANCWNELHIDLDLRVQLQYSRNLFCHRVKFECADTLHETARARTRSSDRCIDAGVLLNTRPLAQCSQAAEGNTPSPGSHPSVHYSYLSGEYFWSVFHVVAKGCNVLCMSQISVVSGCRMETVSIRNDYWLRNLECRSYWDISVTAVGRGSRRQFTQLQRFLTWFHYSSKYHRRHILRHHRSQYFLAAHLQCPAVWIASAHRHYHATISWPNRWI